MESINFIKPVNSYRSQSHSFIWWSMLSGIVLLASLALMIALYVGSAKELKTLHAEQQQNVQRKKMLESLEQEVASAKKEHETLKTAHAVKTEIDLLAQQQKTLLEHLHQVIATAKTQLVSLVIQNKSLELSLSAPELNAIHSLHEKLVGITQLKNPTITSINVKNGKSLATIKAELS